MSLSPDAQQHLCQSCGLCCQGLFFENARIDEAGPHPDWPQAMVDSVEEGRLQLPCQGFQNGHCGVYESRPHVCRQYRCTLLHAVDAGHTELSDAMAMVEETRQLLKSFREAVAHDNELDATQTLRAMYQRYQSGLNNQFADDVFCRQHSAALLSYARLQSKFREHFHDPEEG